MNNLLKGFALALSLIVSQAASATGLIDPALNGFAQGQNGAATAKVIILVNSTQQMATIPKPQRYDRVGVVTWYKEVARQSTLPLLTDIQNRTIAGVKVTGVYWVNGSIAAEVTPMGLRALAQHPSTTKIYKNNIHGRDPVMAVREGAHRSTETISNEYDFTTLGLDRLFKEKPQINGQGAVVGVVDTGVDGSHPALAGKVLSFWNGNTHSTTPPQDFDQHGTHVSGTIAGGNRTDNWIGVAPGAKLAVAGALMNYDTMAEGMQWFLDQEHNPAVAQKVKAVSNSWNTGGAPDQEVFYKALAAWEAAGILPVFSAGNAGPSAGSITHPHEYPGTFAVAAYGPDEKIANFSSRGPGNFHGKPTQKPDLAAPGVQINSSIPGGKYARFDGTSMATPHVTGTVALLLQINPKLNPAQLKEIIVKTLKVPKGMQRGQWTADWGFGQLDSYAAVMGAATFSGINLKMASIGFQTLDSIDQQILANASLGEVGAGVDIYPETDTTAWLNPQDIY